MTGITWSEWTLLLWELAQGVVGGLIVAVSWQAVAAWLGLA